MLAIGANLFQFSKKGKSYIIPDLSGRPSIVLPRSQIPWILDQPDEVLSSSVYHYETLEGQYAFTNSKLLEDPYHEHALHKLLPRRIPAMIPDLQTETADAFNEIWGSDTVDWKEIPLYGTTLSMVSRVANRVIIGSSLCRNEDFLSNSRSFMTDIMRTGVILRFTPNWLRPVVGPLAALPNQWHYHRAAKHSIPVITERLSNFRRMKQDPNFKWDAPNDYLSWFITLALAENREDELTVDMISRRIMPIEFAALHTTTISITNCLLDMASSDPSLQFLEGIRQEAASILAENDGRLTKTALARSIRADSAFRESMRLSNFMTQSLSRKVMPAQGISNEAEGWTAPQGIYVTVDVEGIHHDADIYSHPNDYDAFRFSRSLEASFNNIADGNSNDEDREVGKKNTSLITTSDSFLPFGHGRHACPGRHLVAVQVKLMLMYMTMNYDIEPLPVRPAHKWFASAKIPSKHTSIRIRRKQASMSA